MTATTIPLRPAPGLWRVAQALGVVLTAALVAALVVSPQLSLHILWDMTIPILPAVFLVNPMIWRNVCPLATLNSFTGRRVGRNTIGPAATRALWAVGIVLLLVMVPARRFVFNTNGVVLDATIVAVALLSLGAGALYSRRQAFCNALCPVLPVEKLYGQAPLLEIGNPRCADCTVCTPIGCIDLAGSKTLAQTLGPGRRQRRWPLTAFGLFACAFPGFIVAYFTLDNGALSTWAHVYEHVLLYMVVSVAIVGTAALVAGIGSALLLPILAAVDVMIYYWYSAPTLAKAYAPSSVDTAQLVVRVLALALTMTWLWKAMRRRESVAIA